MRAVLLLLLAIGCGHARTPPPATSDDLELDEAASRRAADEAHPAPDAGANDVRISVALEPDAGTGAGSGTAASPADGPRIDLDVRDAGVSDVLRMIAAAAKIDLVVPDDVKGTVTLDVRRVTWRQAIQVIADMEGLAVHEADGIVTVTKR